MSYKRIENLLPAYSDGSLGARDRKLVEHHLAECPECRRLLALLRETDRALAGFPELKVSPGLRRKLYAVPERKTEKSESWLSFFPRIVRQPVFVPAAVVLLAFTIFMTNPNRDSILRSLNRQVHLGINAAEKVYDRAGSFLDKMNAYKEDALSSLKSINPLSKDGDKNKK